MQERSDVPFGNASLLLLGEGSEATEPFNLFNISLHFSLVVVVVSQTLHFLLNSVLVLMADGTVVPTMTNDNIFRVISQLMATGSLAMMSHSIKDWH